MNALLKKLAALTFFETPDLPSGGGAGTPADGTAPTGQGQTPAGENAGFRQYFPNVPDEHWALIEPHVGQIESHTTQLSQQLAPFKQLVDAGYTPEVLTGLVNFDQQFNGAPLNTWLQLGTTLQQQGLLDKDVDLEYLAAIAAGEDPDAGSAPGLSTGAELEGQPQDAHTQQLLSTIQALQEQVNQLQTDRQNDVRTRDEQIQDRVLETRMTQMREALTKSGWPEELLTDQDLTARVIAHRGDFQAATKSMIDQRSALLKGFTQERNTTPPPTDLPNGAPPTTPRDEGSYRDRGDSFKAATRTAQARLQRANQPG